MTAAERPDKESVLKKLRPFQRRTVSHVASHLFNPQGSRRFLVADEVGLGKTLVARGVIAEFIDRHWHDRGKDGAPRRIDILYLCSNTALANENLRKLHIGGEKFPATRFTLLPRIQERLDARLNFISLTPGTALDTQGTGRKDERLVLYQILRHRFRTGAWVENFLRGQVTPARWEQDVKWLAPLPAGFAEDYLRRLDGNPRLVALLKQMEEAHQRWDSKKAREEVGTTWHVVGELRTLLAQTCISSVQPDLIILDEFQRFKDLLSAPSAEDEETESVRNLCRQLFNYCTPEGDKVALLLLSATPYRLYSANADGGDEEHYRDFKDTIRFLTDDAPRYRDFESSLSGYQRQFRAAALGDGHQVEQAREGLETQLRRVMVRTERVSSTSERDSMLKEVKLPVTIEADDVSHYLAMERVRHELESYDVVDLWKSAPFLLNFMRDYDLKRAVDEQLKSRSKKETALHAARYLEEGEVQRYAALAPAHPRLRALAERSLGNERWKMLWLPPSFPYWELRGPWAKNPHATKQLLFSAWNVAPDAIGSLLSYEAERLMVGAAKFAYGEFIEKRASLLQFNLRDGKAASMTTFALQYPCLALASIHPLALARDAEPLRAAERRVAELVANLAKPGGETDEHWYWAAPLLLDRDSGEVRDFLTSLASRQERKSQADDPNEASHLERRGTLGLAAHAREALAVLDGQLELGAQPEDLVQVLTQLALGGPGILWARTLGEFKVSTHARLRQAFQLAGEFRGLFNEAPVIEMLRREGATDEFYWKAVLRYSVEGNLQAVLDEHAHVLWEGESWGPVDADASAEKVTAAVEAALGTRTSRFRPDYFRVGERVEKTKNGVALRTRFARRYGGKGEEATAQTSADAVRAAFKSPFAPFVLVSTSVGQEGLDFHSWCHAVWHWNLPGNPVDLEQREGRVHRFRGHAVRKNVADAHREKVKSTWQPGVEPWKQLFAIAEASSREAGVSELIPDWLAPGEHKVERCVPEIPMSREVEELRQLKRNLALYRVVFGQPRQEELLRLLVTGDTSAEELEKWVVRLAPPGPGESPA